MGTEWFRRSSARTIVLTLGGALCGVILAAASALIWAMHTETTIQVRRELHTATRALAEHASRKFVHASDFLRTVQYRDAVNGNLAIGDWTMLGHEVQGTGVIDRFGRIVATALPAGSATKTVGCAPLNALSMQERVPESFGLSAGHCVGGQRLFLTKPLKSDGEFVGIAYATFSPDFLADYVQSLAPEQRFSLSLYGPELRPLFAPLETSSDSVSPMDKLRVSKGLQRGETMEAELAAPDSNLFGSEIIALQKLEGVPLVIGLKISSTHYLAQSRLPFLLAFVGALLGTLGVVTAIFFILRMVEKHQNACAELELHKDRLRQAENANRSKSEYLAIMAHEIRTSMSGVLGMAEFMLRSKLYKEQHSGVRVLYDAGQNLVQIINKILDFSKIESGTIGVVEAPFEPTNLVDRVADLFSKEALNKGITIDRVKPPNPVWVQGDEFRIRQILANFVGNALKFTKKGGVRIALHARESNADATRVTLLFEVQDSGIGIPLALQGNLFQPFHQVDVNIEREYGGTGLGLSICKRLSDLMGGKIWMESEEGKGSRFFLELECDRSVAAAKDGVTLPVEADHNQVGARPSILLVEDNASNLKIATMYLERDGYRVTGALDGAEAIEKFHAERFDIILMDGAMPNMDGYEATRRIRAIEEQEKRKRVPIIATTANTGQENEQRCADAGMDDFVPKPYRFSDLKIKIARWYPPQGE